MEDKLGLSGQETVGTLSTAADYRVVYVRLTEDVKLCAEPPADAGSQFGQTFAASFQGPLGGTKEMSADAKAGLAVAMKQLFKRSQGVQLYRDGGFILCNLFLNKGISQADYISELRELRKAAVGLVEKEIPTLNTVMFDPITVPVTPTPAETRTSTPGQSTTQSTPAGSASTSNTPSGQAASESPEKAGQTPQSTGK
jgi:hypothetical protein